MKISQETSEIIKEFITKIDQSYQQFHIWIYTNNMFAKYQAEWNKIDEPTKLFTAKEFSRKTGCKYKNFWDIIIPTLQHGWILGIARLFDPPYFLRDIKKENPRLSVDYISEIINDNGLNKLITEMKNNNKKVINSIKKQRDNYLAHNDIYFDNKKIEAGIEDLFNDLNNIIDYMNKNIPFCGDYNKIDFEYKQKLSKCGVEEIFEALSNY